VDTDHSPTATAATRCPMWDGTFTTDPQSVYERLRAHGPAGPVELVPGVDATLVVEHETALRVLQNPTLFPRDARRWKALQEGVVPPDSPVLPMMAFRPNTMFTDGAAHLRLRQAVTASLDRLNTTRLRRDVEPIADFLIDQFSERGRADLVNEYAKLLPLLLFNKLFGCPAEIGDTLTEAMGALFDAQEGHRGNEDLNRCLLELVRLKRRRPGDDITTWLVQHPAGLSDEELKDQLVLVMGAGFEPLRNLIADTLHLLMSDQGPDGSGLLIGEAMEHVLWNNPPVHNYATHYPTHDVDLGGVLVEADSPLMISFAGANSDPALQEAREHHNKGAHLAWGAGPHACPAKDPSLVIAITAIEHILNALPDLTVAVPDRELSFRPGPFQHALIALPVRFSPTPATRIVAAIQAGSVRPPSEPVAGRPVAAEPVRPGQTAHRRGFWSTLVDLFRV
jgi:cytochrome P450